MPSPILLPGSFLLMVFMISVMGMVVARLVRNERQREIRALARQWGMQYSPRDVFNLAPLIAPHLPMPGAADVRVRDLIYCTDEPGHRYIFCAEYTAGVIRSKSRRQCVVSLLERRATCGMETAERTTCQIAPNEMPLLEQYRAMGPQNVRNDQAPNTNDQRGI